MHPSITIPPLLFCCENDKKRSRNLLLMGASFISLPQSVTKNSDCFPACLTCCCVKKSWSHFSAIFFCLADRQKKTHKSKEEWAFMIMSSSAPSFKHFCGFWIVIYNLELNRPIIPLMHLEKLITDCFFYGSEEATPITSLLAVNIIFWHGCKSIKGLMAFV